MDNNFDSEGIDQGTNSSCINQIQTACFYEENERTNRNDVIPLSEDNATNSGSINQNQLNDELEQPPNNIRQEAYRSDRRISCNSDEHPLDGNNYANRCKRWTYGIIFVLVIPGIILLSFGCENSSFLQLLVGGFLLSASTVWLLALSWLLYRHKESNENIIRSPEVQLVIVRSVNSETHVESRSQLRNNSNYQNPPAYISISPTSQQENLDVPHYSTLQSPSHVLNNSNSPASSKSTTLVDPYAPGSVPPTYDEATSNLDFEL